MNRITLLAGVGGELHDRADLLLQRPDNAGAGHDIGDRQLEDGVVAQLVGGDQAVAQRDPASDVLHDPGLADPRRNR